MLDVWIWIWLAVVCLSAIIEFATMQMVSIWFVAGGLVSLILALCGVDYWIQIVVCIVIGMALLFSLRKLSLKYLLRNNHEKTNVDSLVGTEHKLLEAIAPEVAGSVKINGVVWTAVGETEETEIKAGTLVLVKEVKGNKLIVTKKGE